MNILEAMDQAGIQYKRIGPGVYRSYCPFHNDTGKPNFTIYERTNSYFCYSCRAAGDVIQFLREFHKMSFKDAQRMVTGNTDSSYIKYKVARKVDNTDYKISCNKIVSSILWVYKTHPKVNGIMKMFDEELMMIDVMEKSQCFSLIDKYRLIIEKECK